MDGVLAGWVGSVWGWGQPGTLVPECKTQGPRGLGLGSRNLATFDERGLGGRPSVPGVRRFSLPKSLNARPVPRSWNALATMRPGVTNHYFY